jgi:TonB family protein
MDFLSIDREPEPRVTRLSRTEAVVASVAIHALVLFLLFWLPDNLPEPIRRFLEPRPMTTVAQVVPALAEAQLTQPHSVPPKPPRIPLKFAYVKVPNDTATGPNPNARLLSDKNRHARQEVPTPPDARKFTSDPHSKGDTIDRVKPDPRLAKGPDMPNPSEPPAPKVPEASTLGTGGKVEGPGTGTAREQLAQSDLARQAEARRETATASANGLMPRAQDSTAGATGSSGEEAGGAGGAPRRPVDTKPGTEYKFNFNNDGWLRGGAYGTLSFDTQGFPWGDYARQLYVIIRNSWLERIPLAAREGIAGYTCQHFVIAKSGEVSDIDITRTSPVPPFNKAASDAIRASSPLPPLPSDFPDPQEGVTFCFFYNMYPGEAD